MNSTFYNDKTPYTETEILLAVMNGDVKRTHELINYMSLSELNRFIEQINRMDIIVHEIRARKNENTHG